MSKHNRSNPSVNLRTLEQLESERAYHHVEIDILDEQIASLAEEPQRVDCVDDNWPAAYYLKPAGFIPPPNFGAAPEFHINNLLEAVARVWAPVRTTQSVAVLAASWTPQRFGQA